MASSSYVPPPSPPTSASPFAWAPPPLSDQPSLHPPVTHPSSLPFSNPVAGQPQLESAGYPTHPAYIHHPQYPSHISHPPPPQQSLPQNHYPSYPPPPVPTQHQPHDAPRGPNLQHRVHPTYSIPFPNYPYLPGPASHSPLPETQLASPPSAASAQPIGSTLAQPPSSHSLQSSSSSVSGDVAVKVSVAVTDVPIPGFSKRAASTQKSPYTTRSGSPGEDDEPSRPDSLHSSSSSHEAPPSDTKHYHRSSRRVPLRTTASDLLLAAGAHAAANANQGPLEESTLMAAISPYSFATNKEHQVDRQFQCQECEMSFNRSHDLKRHRRIHLDIKPFECHVCEKAFSRKDALRRHWMVKGCSGENSPGAGLPRVTIDTDLFKPTKRKKQSGCEPHSDGCQEAILQPTKKPRRKPNVDEDEDGDSVSDEMPVAGPSRKTDKSGQFKSASKGKGREKRNGISEANEKEDVNDDEEMELSREGDGTGRGVTRGVDQDGDGDASLDQSEADELADESFRTESSGISASSSRTRITKQSPGLSRRSGPSHAVTKSQPAPTPIPALPPSGHYPMPSGYGPYPGYPPPPSGYPPPPPGYPPAYPPPGYPPHYAPNPYAPPHPYYYQHPPPGYDYPHNSSNYAPPPLPKPSEESSIVDPSAPLSEAHHRPFYPPYHVHPHPYYGPHAVPSAHLSLPYPPEETKKPPIPSVLALGPQTPIRPSVLAPGPSPSSATSRHLQRRPMTSPIPPPLPFPPAQSRQKSPSSEVSSARRPIDEPLVPPPNPSSNSHLGPPLPVAVPPQSGATSFSSMYTAYHHPFPLPPSTWSIPLNSDQASASMSPQQQQPLQQQPYPNLRPTPGFASHAFGIGINGPSDVNQVAGMRDE